MTEAQAFEAIREAFDAAWTVAHPTIPYFLDNETASTSDSFVQVSIMPLTSEQATMGPTPQRRWLRRGEIWVRIYVPINQGDGPLIGLCDDVRTALEGQSFGVSSSIDAGRTERQPADGSWNMAIVKLPYRFYETR